MKVTTHEIDRHFLEKVRVAVDLAESTWLGEEQPAERHPEEFVDCELIGSGGQGRVYRAWDTTVPRHVAVKILNPSLAARSSWKEEVRALAENPHPNIVTIYQAGVGERPYLVMEYVDGPTLDELITEIRGGGPDRGNDCARLARRFREVGQRLELARSITSALSFCHAKGFLHRDLKPRNILISRQGVPKLADFGLVHRAGKPEPGSVTQRLVGTLPYMAPEQIRSFRTGSDPRSDIYALGAVLYELFALQRAFPHPEDELMDAIRFTTPPRIRGVGNQLNEVIQTCLRKDPSERYGSMATLAGDLQRVSELRPIVGVKQPWYRHAQLWLERNRRHLRFALALLFTVVAVGSAAWLGRSWYLHRADGIRVKSLIQSIQPERADPGAILLQLHGVPQIQREIDELDRAPWSRWMGEDWSAELQGAIQRLALIAVQRAREAESQHQAGWVASPWRRIASELSVHCDERMLGSTQAVLSSFGRDAGVIRIETTSTTLRGHVREWATDDVYVSETAPSEAPLSMLGGSIELGPLPVLGVLPTGQAGRKYRLTVVDEQDKDSLVELDLALSAMHGPIDIEVQPPYPELPEFVPGGLLTLRSSIAGEGTPLQFRVADFLVRPEPVTVGEFRRFLEHHPQHRSLMQTVELPPREWELEHTPCVVPWQAAVAYLHGQGARLPTLAEAIYLSMNHPDLCPLPDALLPGGDRTQPPYGEWCGDGLPRLPMSHVWTDHHRGSASQSYFLWFRATGSPLPGEKPVVFRCVRSSEWKKETSQ